MDIDAGGADDQVDDLEDDQMDDDQGEDDLDGGSIGTDEDAGEGNMDVMPLFNLRGLLLSTLYRITRTEESAIRWCQQQELLWDNPQCNNCGQLMEYETPRRRFRCRNGPCGGRKWGIRSGTFFEGTRLDIAQILEFVYHWCMNRFQQTDYMTQICIGSEHTVVEWKCYCRNVCADYLEKHPTVIGGPGKTVEIDECLLVRRKYNRGRIVRQRWVFGGVESGSKACFLVAVQKRDTATLWPLIQRNIRLGSTIVSDEWAAYNVINQQPHPRPYVHLTVNHSRNFVDPDTGACTNHVESMWQKAKHAHKKRFGMHRSLLDSYLCEYMWRRLFPENAFHHFVSQIRAQYSVW